MQIRKTASALPWHLELDWEVDTAGYYLKEFTPAKSRTVLTGATNGWHVVPRGGVIKKYKLRDLESRERGKAAFTEYANLEAMMGGALDPQRLLAFVGIYGLPSPRPAEMVSLLSIARDVRNIKNFLSSIASGFEFRRQIGTSTSQKFYIEQVETERGAEHRIILSVQSLSNFLWMQMLIATQQKIKIKYCISCGNFMAAKSEGRDTCGEACRQRIYRSRDQKQAADGPPKESGRIKTS